MMEVRMQAWRNLVPTSFRPLQILCEPNALLRPRGLRDGAGRRLPAGLFRPDGSAIDPSLPAPDPRAFQRTSHTPPDRFRRGAWVYGGVLLNHFGHVMIETGARLWAVPELLSKGVALDGIIFQRKKAAETPGEGQMPSTSAAFLSVFSPDIPVAVVDGAETIETLYVPEIGISVTPDRFVGTREHWTFFRDRAGRVKPHPDPSDIYVSRTQDGARGGFLFEADLEAVMAAAGYRIFHPQHHSVSDQIAIYRSARRLVSIDGSALHLAASALAPEARVAILARREFFAWAIADQLRSAAGCKVSVVDARKAVYNFASPMTSPGQLATVKGWSSSFVLPDFGKLGDELVQNGFLDSTPVWPTRGPTDLDRELRRASRLHKEALMPVSEAMLALQPYFNSQIAEGVR